MANTRLSMRKIKDVLRLTHDVHLNTRQVALSLNISRSTVTNYQDRAQKAGLSWPLPEDLTEEALEQKLFPSPVCVEAPAKALPDFDYIYRELKAHKKFNLTLDQLWREYREQQADGYQYSQYCQLYRDYRSKLDYSMRQDHKGGEKLFVDYGEGLSLIDPQSGDLIKTELFVAVWGASTCTFAEASLTQQLPDWIGSHVRAFEYFGCAPKIVVPDCLKSAVSRACRYEPDINPTYADMASHYGICVIPARPARPKDKAKVENGVLIANVAIAELLERLNNRALRKIKQSRHELFVLFDQPNALGLPQKSYQYAAWKIATVNIDYHIEVDDHYYSVPYQLKSEKLQVRLSAYTVEAFRKGQRVASHIRSFVPHQHTTLKEHMPPAHRKYSEWSPDRFIRWAEKTGPHTARLVKTIIESRAHPEQGYRSCLGILRLDKHYPKERLENAAARALRYSNLSLRALRKILENGLDRLEEKDSGPTAVLPAHDNIRGGQYYH
jgi:transposase